jgi:hypothetical protein
MAIFVTSKSPSWPISVGAEGIAAAQFARCGFDVLVQAGRDKPWYDLVVTRDGSLLKVSVKASETGQWGLAESYIRRTAEVGGNRLDCRNAVDMWADSYGSRTICCLVQFQGSAIHQLPRIYLAYPSEIALRMRVCAERTGHCALIEEYEWTSPDGDRQIEVLPVTWLFSEKRIQELSAPQPVSWPVRSVASVPAVPEIRPDVALTA